MLRDRTKAPLLAAALLIAASIAWPAFAEPLPLRLSWVNTPAQITPMMTAVPGLAKHAGSSYSLQLQHFAASPAIVSAMAASELDIAALGFSTLAIAIENARLDDLRVICVENEDGVADYYSVPFVVLRDSSIRSIEDLRGKIVGTNGISSNNDVALRTILRQHGLEDKRDYTAIEVQVPNMRAMLTEEKINLALPFSHDPEMAKIARPLFFNRDAYGATELSLLTVRQAFLDQHRAAIVDFLEDYLRTVRWLIDPAHRSDALAITAQISKQSVEALEPWAFTQRDYYRNPDGLPNVDALQKNITAEYRLGFIKQDLDVARYVELAPVKEAARRLQ